MTTSTYQPTGKGLCAQCGCDVGAHDAGHKPRLHLVDTTNGHEMWCLACDRMASDPVHDVGRVLTCPEVRDD